jgi:hypothetical protein
MQPSASAPVALVSLPAADRHAEHEILDAGGEEAIGIGIHDASRFEWTVTVPLPAHRARSLDYAIEVDLEVPTNAVARRSPWEQIQTFTRLDEAGRPRVAERGAVTEGVALDALRRGAVSLGRMLARGAAGFARHAGIARARERDVADAEGDRYGFLVIWLEAALLAVAETREQLTRAAPGDTPRLGRERALVDEYASVGSLEMLASASRALGASGAAALDEELQRAVARVRARIDQATLAEIAHRRGRGYLTMTEPSPPGLDAYVARAARLKTHFEEVLWLDRESYQLDERVQQWMTSVAAVVAGGSAFVLQLALVGRHLPEGVALGSRLLAIAVLAGACYMARDRIKEIARTWLTGKLYRLHAQRVTRYRLPERRLPTRDVLIRTREWCNQTTQSLPDVLNPQGGASLPRTRIRYLQRGVVVHQVALSTEGVSRVRHIFRYDVSPLLPRLADDVRQVPFVAADGSVAFADAPRRYQVPVRVRLRTRDVERHVEATVVLEKRGITRIDPGIAADALAPEEGGEGDEARSEG